MKYLTIFLLTFIIISIIYFFSVRKYDAIKNSSSEFGFLPELNVYFKTTGRYCPFDTTDYIKSWLMTAFFACLFVLVICMLADLIESVI